MGTGKGHRRWLIAMKGNRIQPHKNLFGAVGAWAICRSGAVRTWRSPSVISKLVNYGDRLGRTDLPTAKDEMGPSDG